MPGLRTAGGNPGYKLAGKSFVSRDDRLSLRVARKPFNQVACVVLKWL
jgi:hypothetical protein